MGIHPRGIPEFKVLGVRIAEQHHHAILALVIVPLTTRQRDVAISVPDPVALNDFRGGLEGHFRAFDRARRRAFRTTDHLDLKIVEGELGQITVAILQITVGAINAARGERPEIPFI